MLRNAFLEIFGPCIAIVHSLCMTTWVVVMQDHAVDDDTLLHDAADILIALHVRDLLGKQRVRAIAPLLRPSYIVAGDAASLSSMRREGGYDEGERRWVERRHSPRPRPGRADRPSTAGRVSGVQGG